MKTIALLLAALLLAGCRGGDREPPAAAGDEEGVFDPLTDQVDQAKAVEGQIMDQKEAVDEALQRAEGEAADPAGEEEDPAEQP
jgi:hypothetical protein